MLPMVTYIPPQSTTCFHCKERKYLSDFSIQMRRLEDSSQICSIRATCNTCQFRPRPGKPHTLFVAPKVEWAERASCREAEHSWFFADIRSSVVKKAVEFCRNCPVMALCAAYAASTGSTGVWGGKYFYEPAQHSDRAPVDLLTTEPPKPGAKTLLEKGKCLKGGHPILSEEDIVPSRNGAGSTCRRCKQDYEATRVRRVRPGVTVSWGHLCKQGIHRISSPEDLSPRYACRACDNERRKKSYRRLKESPVE